jgi:hypothetical protein
MPLPLMFGRDWSLGDHLLAGAWNGQPKVSPGNFPQTYSMGRLILTATKLLRSWEACYWRNSS